MIYLLTGVPRSGKTYYAVNWISENCLKKSVDEWVIIHNIEGLTVGESLSDFMPEKTVGPCPSCGKKMRIVKGKNSEFMGCSGFPDCKHTENIEAGGKNLVLFTERGMKRLQERYQEKKIVILIDECQQLFGKMFSNREVLLGFEKHGHYGLDIFLITQNQYQVSKSITVLSEFEIRAIPKTLQLGWFYYRHVTGGNTWGNERIRKKKEVFALYKSQFKESGQVKYSGPLRKYAPYLIILIVVFSFSAYRLLRSDNNSVQGKIGKSVIGNVSNQIQEVGYKKKEYEWHDLPSFKIEDDLYYYDDGVFQKFIPSESDGLRVVYNRIVQKKRVKPEKQQQNGGLIL